MLAVTVLVLLGATHLATVEGNRKVSIAGS